MVLTAIGSAAVLTQNFWVQWKDEQVLSSVLILICQHLIRRLFPILIVYLYFWQVVTVLKDTARPITEVPFPALTICASGLHMNDVEKKLTKDFNEWRAMNNRNETTKEAIDKDVEEFMLQRFQIEPGKSPSEQAISILDILDMMISPDVDASIAASSVRENAIACKKSTTDDEECSQSPTAEHVTNSIYFCSDSRFKLFDKKCFFVSEKKVKKPHDNACNDMGASLAQISSPAEDDFVLELMKQSGGGLEHVYIGLRDMAWKEEGRGAGASEAPSQTEEELSGRDTSRNPNPTVVRLSWPLTQPLGPRI